MNGYSPNVPTFGLPSGHVNNVYGIYDHFTEGGYHATTAGKFVGAADVGVWFYTALTGTPTFVIKDAARGGYLAAATGAATDNHGFECMLNGEAFALTAGKDMGFEISFSSRNSVTAFDWAVGFCTTETSLLATPAANFIGFTSGAAITSAVLDGGAANIIARTIDDSGGVWTAAEGTLQNSKDTGEDLVAGTDVKLSVYVQMKGSIPTVHFYVNDVIKHKVSGTTCVPDVGDALTFAFAAQNNGATQAIMDIDWIRAWQVR